MSARVAFVLLLVLTVPTWAQPGADDRGARVQRLLARGAYPAAYEEAAALLDRAPHDARAQELFVRAASLALRLDAAERQLEAALAEHPDDVGLQAAHAEWLFGKGDEVAARAVAERVLRADPAQSVAKDIVRALDVADRARARVEQQGTRFEAGSPEAFVDEFIESGVRGKEATALAGDVDLDLLRNAELRSPIVIANFIGQFIDDARAAAARGDQRFLGWLVAPAVPQDGDRVRVHVDVPGEAVFTDARRRFVERALADPSLRGVAERDAIERLLAIPEGERPAILDRLVGTRMRSSLAVEFELLRSPNGWRISDLVVGGMSIREAFPRMGAVGRAINATKREASGAEQRPGNGESSRAWYWVAGLVGIVAAILGLVVLYARRRRRA